MKPLALRTKDLTQNDIRAITIMLKEVGGINLGQGICDMPTPDPIKHGAHQAIDENHSTYSNYAGIKRLRTALLHKAQTFNKIPITSEDEIVVSAGSTGAFVTALFALLEAGDEVILFEPFYGYHLNLLQIMGAVPRFVSTKPPNFALDFDAIERAITPKTKALLINTPGNPSGKVWTRAELEQALALMQKHDLYAITDEIYEYMLYDGHVHVSLASLPGAYERTITLSGFSKTYNMTGWRLGYAMAPQPIIGKMGLLNDLVYICAPTPLQHGVAEAFEMPGTYFTDMQAAYAKKRVMMCEALEAIGFDVPWPERSYYVLGNFERLAQQRPGFEDDFTACKTLINEAGVGAVPGKSFFADPEDGRYYLRFCYAKEFHILEEACERLVKAFG